MILIFFDSNKILKNSKQNKLESNNFFFKEKNLEIIIKSKYILEFVYIIWENLSSEKIFYLVLMIQSYGNKSFIIENCCTNAYFSFRLLV